MRIYCPSYVWESDTPDSEEGFREKNDTLMNLYEVIADNWNNRIPPDMHHPAWAFLVGQASMISRKVRQAHICPQHSHIPIIKWVENDSKLVASNNAAINALYAEMKSKGMSSTTRYYHKEYKKNLGIMCGKAFDGSTSPISYPSSGYSNGEQFTALEIADFLDNLSWNGHNPSKARHPYLAPRGIIPPSLGKTNLYRKPESTMPENEKIPSAGDPYSIAAYLRLWYFQAKDKMVANAPKFNVIFRDGTSVKSYSFPDGQTVKLRKYSRAILPTGQITNYEWGSINSVANFGSNLNNDDVRKNWPTKDETKSWRSFRSKPRPVGAPGMLQIRFIEDPSTGFSLPIVSLSIPLGGPTYSYHGGK